MRKCQSGPPALADQDCFTESLSVAPRAWSVPEEAGAETLTLNLPEAAFACEFVITVTRALFAAEAFSAGNPAKATATSVKNASTANPDHPALRDRLAVRLSSLMSLPFNFPRLERGLPA